MLFLQAAFHIFIVIEKYISYFILGESRSFNLQLPSNISWAMNGEYRLKSPFTTSSSTSLFSNAPSYRSPNHSNYTRRRRRLLSANFFTSKKKSGST